MPIHSVEYRAACGYHDKRVRKYVPSSVVQSKANHIAKLQHHKTVNQINAVSLLYLSGLLLPVLHHVISSPQPICRPQEGNNATGLRPFNTRCFSQTLSRVSSFSLNQTGNTFDWNGDESTCTARVNRGAHRREHAAPSVKTVSWFSLPLAAATLPYLTLERQGGIEGALIARDDVGKRLILSVAKNFLENIEGFSAAEREKREFEWLSRSAHAPIMLMRVDIELPVPSRNKRISFTDKEKEIKDHILHHCVEEKEIFHSSGENEGKVYIFIAQRIDNPFRMLYDNIDDFEPPPVLQKVASGLNYFVNILTLGLKDTLSGPIANYFRYKYYNMQGDDICATRQLRRTLAQLMTSLDIDNGMRFIPNRDAASTFETFGDFIPFNSKAKILSRDRSNNIETEVFFLAERKGTNDQNERVAITLQENNGMEIASPEMEASGSGKQTLVYDAQDNTWRDKASSKVIPLTLHVDEGERIVQVSGVKFPLRKNSDGDYEIVVKPPDGSDVFLPVYMEPLSKSWHLSKKHHRSVFTHYQQRYFDRIKIINESEFQYRAIYNANPNVYGEGRLYEVRLLHAEVNTTPPLFIVVEMNGNLLPVKTLPNHKHGIRYDIFDIKSPFKKSFPIEWDGERWVLESQTSSYISDELAKRITPDMYVSEIAEQSLSVHDDNGIKWIDQHCYLKFKNKYIEIIDDNGLFIISPTGRNLAIKFYGRRYFPITQQDLNERNSLLQKKKRINDFIDELKEQLQKAIITNITFVNVENIAKLFFTPDTVQISSIASSELDKKRYLVIIDGESFIMETTRSGDDVFLLHGDAAELALSKYIAKYTQDNMKVVAAVQRDYKEYQILSRSRNQIKFFANELIEHGALLIEEVAREINKRVHEKKSIIIGNDDFFETSSFENHLYPSLENAYQMLRDKFIPLSIKYPEMIIIPGSIYIAEDISDDLLSQGVIYEDNNNQRLVDDIINFTAIVVPVFHRGKCIAIARKGEYLTTQGNTTNRHTDIASLDNVLAPSTVIKIHNVKNDSSGNAENSSEARTGTIFVGKTLLPREEDVVQKVFRSSLPSQIDTNASQLFGSEFMIDNDKFLLVIGDEYQQNAGEKSTVRSLAYPQQEDTKAANRYDWILHLSAGSEIDPILRAAGDNYVQVDRVMSGKCVSDFHQRVCFTSYSEERKISLYEFISEH